MIGRRGFLIALGAGAIAAPFGVFAQPLGKVWRIGFLSSASEAGYRSRVDALRAGLREFGYVEGKNLIIEFRWAEGKAERLPDLAAELVRLNVDAIVAHSTPPIRAARQSTTIIPIVMATSADPVALGLVTSLAVPGGNITGSTYFPAELTAKRIELLKDALPRIASVAVLADLTITATRQMYMQAMEATAKVAKIALHEFPVRGPDEFGSTFEAMKKRHFGAVAVPENPMFIANAKALADLALKQHLPLIGGGEFADAGALLGYGANLVELYRRVGYFVDKIFKGAKPGSIPVEQPTKFELVVNMRTARALGIKIPNSIHVRADKVID